ncbi:hypothetical protein [Nocardia pneumoniae]|uniref:hypothetical protein n=1 Tax=Nocardia pneumoniae TaxID=228601 RepID=UPI0002E1C1DA|nr:hypothetical protein [Nocardia pneumoniae]
MTINVDGPDCVALQVRDVEAAGVVSPPQVGPFGRTFTFLGPEGYAITAHGG